MLWIKFWGNCYCRDHGESGDTADKALNERDEVHGQDVREIMSYTWDLDDGSPWDAELDTYGN